MGQRIEERGRKGRRQGRWGIGNHGTDGPYDPKKLNGNRTILGSFRDPWSHYVSLWAYREGALHKVRPSSLSLARILDAAPTESPACTDSQRDAADGLAEQMLKTQGVYGDVFSADKFRVWLTAMLTGKAPNGKTLRANSSRKYRMDIKRVGAQGWCSSLTSRRCRFPQPPERTQSEHRSYGTAARR
jgi:hypothetical protein